MKPDEVEILKRYLSSVAPPGTWTIDYRWPMTDREVPQDLVGGARDMFVATHQKRSEAVCVSGSTVWIVEVKPRVNSSALGQLLNYRDLARRVFASNYNIRMVCVAGADDSLVSPSLRAQGIEVVIV